MSAMWETVVAAGCVVRKICLERQFQNVFRLLLGHMTFIRMPVYVRRTGPAVSGINPVKKQLNYKHMSFQISEYMAYGTK